jgi:anti-sigma regulatory factor (Ser/Thr protein kinase)
VLPATLAAVSGLPDWVATWAVALELSPDLVYRLELCTEEAVSNVVRHGLADMPNSTVTLSLTAEPALVRLQIEDAGKPFDPTAAPLSPSVAGPLADAPVGGQGIRLIRRFASHIAYERRGDLNRLTLEFARS